MIKRPLELIRCVDEDNINMSIREIEYEDVDWIHLTQVTVHWQLLLSMVMQLRVWKKESDTLTTLATVSLS
jgi:hypothetical protein